MVQSDPVVLSEHELPSGRGNGLKLGPVLEDPLRNLDLPRLMSRRGQFARNRLLQIVPHAFLGVLQLAIGQILGGVAARHFFGQGVHVEGHLIRVEPRPIEVELVAGWYGGAVRECRRTC